MNFCARIILSFTLALAATIPAAAERARDIIGAVTVKVIYASDAAITGFKDKLAEPDAAVRERLTKDPNLRFAHYGLAGIDTKPLYRSVENWAQPITSSDDVLVRFEADARPSKDVTRLDIELWLSRKKILKAGIALTADKPLYVRGPKWKDGHMLLVVMLEPYQRPVKAISE